MATSFADRLRASQGFTLIELLVVLIILGILASIVVFATGTFTSDSQTSACKANAKIMNTAEGAYASQHAGALAAGNAALLQPYMAEPVPTSGAGAVQYDSTSKVWVCA